VEVYVGDPVLIGTLTQFVPQSVTVATMSYQVHEHKEYNSVIYWTYGTHHGSYKDDGLDDTVISWLAGAGGVAQSVGFDDNLPGTYDTQNSFGPNQSDFQAAGWLWENATVDVPAWSDTTADGWPEWGSFQRQAATRVQLVPPGGQANGLTNVYLVRFAAAETDNFPPDWDESLLPLPPETFEIGNQPLVNTGETNMDDSTANGAVWGMTTISAPAGQNVEVTPSLITTPQGNWDYYFDVQACQLYPPMVDVNRDGVIDGNDVTTADQPYRFWVNNDHDGYDSSISDYADLDPTSVSDANNTAIPCTRDLEDYSRLWINTKGIKPELQNGTFLLALEWKNTTGTPAIRLFPAVETNGGTLYLTDESTALAQSNAPYGHCIIDSYVGQDKVAGNLPFIIPTNFWATAASGTDTNYFLFDAVSRGSGQLVVAVYKKDGVTKLAEGPPLYLKLQDVKEMYERYTVGEDPSSAPASTASLVADPYSYDSTIPAENNYILFVHGWNLATWEKDAFAETAFKRLYWQGYKGHFGSFRWPTGYGFSGDISGILDADNFDNSEFNAWSSGTGLLGLLNSLNSTYSGHVYLIAHSMGNVVAGEALRLAGSSQVVNTYVAMQGAIASHAYDPTTYARTNDLNLYGIGYNSHAPNFYASYYTNGAPCYFNGTAGAGSYINFYNSQDYALARWEVDEDFKPDGHAGFSYNSSSNEFYLTGTELYFPNDTYVIFPYCATAFCYGLGEQGNVSGAFKVGLTFQQVDLGVTFGFGNTHADHSAEFNSDNMNRAAFWDTLLNKIHISP